MHGVKDQTNLCQAFVELCRGHPALAARVRLVMIGDGPLRQPCLDMLAQAGLTGLAWLPGSRDDVPEIMRALDVFVLPSRAEGISNTILEAMASGLPVIATDVGGNGELIANGESGTLVPAGDSAALSAQMAAYAADESRRRRHGDVGCRRVGEHFSMTRMLDAYSGLYDQLMEQRGVAH